MRPWDAGVLAVAALLGSTACGRRGADIRKAPEKERPIVAPPGPSVVPTVTYLVGRVGERVAIEGKVSSKAPRITRASPGKVVDVLLLDGSAMHVTAYVAEHPSCDSEHVRLVGEVVVTAGYLAGGAAYAEPQLDADSWTCVK